jgi:peptidoglycan/LPS O-acetylase OafA/YrhL
MKAIPGYPAKKSDWFWCIMGCVWGAGLLVHVAPFLHWSHARTPAALIHWIVYLPLSAVAVLAFRALLALAPEAPNESKNVGYISRLDHLRFFAAILVVMFHFYHGLVPLEDSSQNPLLTLFGEGSSGVDLFFVLSGFIFGLIGQGKIIHYGNFMLSRLVRVYPLYLLGIVIVMAANRGRFTPLDFGLLFLPVLNLDYLPTLPGFGQLWTIGLEFQFYLIFPFLMAFVARHGARYLVGLMVLGLAVRGFYFSDVGTVRDISQWSMLGRFDQFAIGILAATWYFRRGQRQTSPVHLGLAIMAVLAGLQWLAVWGGYQRGEKSPLWIIWDTVEGVMWAYLVVSYLTCRVELPRWWDQLLSRLGQLSFSIYVFHSYAMYWALKHFASTVITGSREWDAVLLGLFICVPLAVLIALPSYHLIEKQFFVFRRKYVEPLPSSVSRVK